MCVHYIILSTFYMFETVLNKTLGEIEVKINKITLLIIRTFT